MVERDLALNKSTEVSKSLEGIEKEIKEMGSGYEVVTHIGIKEENAFQLDGRGNSRCYRCNDDNHLANVCRFNNSICNVCNLKGHISRACRNKEELEKNGKSRKQNNH